MSYINSVSKLIGSKYLARNLALLIAFRLGGLILKFVYSRYRYKTVLKEGESILITKRSKKELAK